MLCRVTPVTLHCSEYYTMKVERATFVKVKNDSLMLHLSSLTKNTKVLLLVFFAKNEYSYGANEGITW